MIGTEVLFPLLHAVTDYTEASIQQNLTRLQAAEFLYETQSFPRTVYTFKHALRRQAATA